MLCDLVGSTPLSTRLDPEDLREVVGEYQKAVLTAVRAVGGHVAQLLGDGLLIYFGYPTAFEDAAARGCRAALSILDALVVLNGSLSARMGVSIACRIGLHTGTTVIGAMGDDSHVEQLAVGEAPNIVARIQAVASPGAILLSNVTARMVSEEMELESVGVHTLTGAGHPIELFRLLSPRSITRSRRIKGRSATPFVGRRGDLAVLRELWKDAQRGAGRMALIVGEVGVGKTRILQAFAEDASVDGAATILECTGNPSYANSAFHPLLELLRDLFGFEPDVTPIAAARRVRDGCARLGLGEEASSLLTAVLGLPPDHAASELSVVNSPQVRKQKTCTAIVDVLVRSAAKRPTLVLVEDLQWVDNSTIELFVQLSKSIGKAAVLLVFTARPTFHAPWPVQSTLVLDRLAEDEATALLQAAVHGKTLPSDVVQLILSKADGVPLYIEELVHMLLDSGQLVERAGCYVRAESAPMLTVPATLHDSLMARLDHSSAKAALQVGATIGRQFDYLLIRALIDRDESDLQKDLQALTDAGLLLCLGRPPAATYYFRHGLVQDVAYESLLKRTRQQYHRRIAELIPSIDPQVPPEVLAHHQRESGQFQEALHSFAAAGRAALGEWALAEASHHFQSALALVDRLPVGAERAFEELDLRVMAGVPLMLTRGFGAPEVEATYSRALELCDHIGDAAADRLFPVLWGLWIFNHVRSALDKAEEIGVRLLSLAERTGDSAIVLGANQALGATRFWLGRIEDAKAHFDRALSVYDEPAHAPLAQLFGQDGRVFSLAMSIWIAWLEGRDDDARTLARQTMATVERVRQPGSRGFADLIIAVYHCLAGEPNAARLASTELIELSHEQGMPHWEACGKITFGWAQCADAGSLALIRSGVETLAMLGTRTASVIWFSALAEAALAAGEIDQARAVASARAFVESTNERCLEAEVSRLEGRVILAADPTATTAADERFQNAITLAAARRQPALVRRAERERRHLVPA
jgi:class 3 adenylate cyclase/tetratricopeptide (TPR) repeat protein